MAVLYGALFTRRGTTTTRLAERGLGRSDTMDEIADAVAATADRARRGRAADVRLLVGTGLLVRRIGASRCRLKVRRHGC